MMHEEFPLVSVVVLTYNGLEFLQKTVQPLLDLSYPNLEIIYVDNASTDGSVEYLKQFSRIVVIENKINEGFNKGKNIGIQHAKGEYVFSLDGDILINDKDVVERMVERFTPGTGIIQLPLFDVDKEKTKYYGIYFTAFGVHRNIPWASREEISKLPEMLPIASATGACLFFRRDVWNGLGGFDESQVYHLDESDIGPRFAIFGYSNFLYTKRVLTHLGVKHASSSKIYAHRYRYLFSGEGVSIIKNDTFGDVCLRFPLFFLYQCIKAIRFSFIKGDIRVFYNFCVSIGIFFSILPNALRNRKDLQSRRKVATDDFLSIKPPRL
ncbi:MAG: glycosyltransferase [Candidatus Uhrbacteria bacterium]|nr:glycosyltransferase [Candidatus Uhrbacteria bacterium]